MVPNNRLDPLQARLVRNALESVPHLPPIRRPSLKFAPYVTRVPPESPFVARRFAQTPTSPLGSEEQARLCPRKSLEILAAGSRRAQVKALLRAVPETEPKPRVIRVRAGSVGETNDRASVKPAE